MKRATGDISGWNLLDIERAFSGSDNARLQINSTAAELTGTVFVEPSADGFSVVSTNPNFNANGSRYIYVAIRAPS
ncbi:hypothetical protein [Oceanibaculum nanhaiense]|uniref:hypothetical protein n=1 Tax=Oceanibaculum nanhaiense TaxID=1909734 RepID=UPI003D2BBD31